MYIEKKFPNKTTDVKYYVYVPKTEDIAMPTTWIPETIEREMPDLLTCVQQSIEYGFELLKATGEVHVKVLPMLMAKLLIQQQT